MLNKLLLTSGQDIPFEEGQLIIHPPSIQEIALIGEHALFAGLQVINLSKDTVLAAEDKSVSENLSNFDIYMTVMKNREDSQQLVENIEMLFSIIFPMYQTQLLPDRQLFIRQTEGGIETGYLDRDNFEIFKDYLQQIFCMKDLIGDSPNYDPGNERARQLAEKFQRARKKVAELNPDKEERSIFQRISGVLAVGEQKDINQIMNYTVFQLLDEYNRFVLKYDYDRWFSAKLAGAKDLKAPEQWTK